jgi:uncharacterized DUF497 family protein
MASYSWLPRQMSGSVGMVSTRPVRSSSLLTVYTIIVYTRAVLDQLDGFDWDAANVDHIMRHAVTPFEVEEAAGRAHLVIPAKTVKGEKRWKLFGKTGIGRCLVAVFTIRRKRFRAVTAYKMNAAEKSNYGSQIG